MPKKPKQKSKPKTKVKVLKVRHPVVAPPIGAAPVVALVEAIAAKEVVEIKFIDPEPTRWESIKNWLMGPVVKP